MPTFPIAPADGRYLWFLIPVALLMVGVIAILVVSLRGARATQFVVTTDGLQLRGDLYGRTVPMRQLRVESARRVDLSAEPQLRPRWKRIGTNLPGYQAGWFRLRNGEKALLYLTDRSKAVYIPTSAGYSLVLSPSDPNGFLGALRSRSRPNDR